MKAALYARVSTEEQTEGYSIDAQRRAFNALCQGRGWTPYQEYIEVGKSAHTDNINKRPVFKEAMGDALDKKYDVLVVHKIDRFARKLPVTLEYFNKLSKAGVGFLSIQNEMDYTTPQGKFNLAIQGALAEMYSDNLSEETKKGWRERKAQGLYCGLLPFGAIKGKNGVPKPNPETYSGLVRAFELAAEGKTDREVSEYLNTNGYRTAGNQGSKPFSSDTVRGILINRFYISELPDGNGGYVQAKHKPFIDMKLWNAVQKARERNRKSPRNHTANSSLGAFTGYAYCWYCGSRMRTGQTYKGKKRLTCANKVKFRNCESESGMLEIYEAQLMAYLENLVLPSDYIDRIVEIQKDLEVSYNETEVRRKELEARFERNKRMYKWGDMSETDYLVERNQIKSELDKLTPHEYNTMALEKLAALLKNIPQLWREADQNQRNAIGRQIFNEVWVKDKKIVAVRPTEDFEPFFRVSFDDWNTVYASKGSNPIGVACNTFS